MPSLLRPAARLVLAAARDRLVARGVANGQAALRVADTDREAALRADRFALVVPLELTALPGLWEGAGRAGATARGRLEVYARIESAADPAYADDALVAGADGLLALVEAAEDALDEYFPEDGSGNALCVVPLRWVRTGPPRRGRSAAWGAVVAEFDFVVWRPRT